MVKCDWVIKMDNIEKTFEEEKESDEFIEKLVELDGFSIRLAKLIDQSELNDRQLSIFIGKNAGYINKIINGETFPTIKSFIIICKALKITPEEFFRYDDDSPVETNKLILDIRKLDYMEKKHVHNIVKDIIK